MYVQSLHLTFQSHEVRLALSGDGCVEYLASHTVLAPVPPEALHSSGYRPDTPRGLGVVTRGAGEPLVSWDPVLCASSYELWYGSLDQGETDSGTYSRDTYTYVVRLSFLIISIVTITREQKQINLEDTFLSVSY